MKLLLGYLTNEFMWLLEKGAFSLSGSHYDSRMDLAWVEIRSDVVVISFMAERDRIFMEFEPPQGDEKSVKGVTLDLLAKYLDGEFLESSYVNSETSGYVKSRMKGILNLFVSNNALEIKKIFAPLKRQRAKLLFG